MELAFKNLKNFITGSPLAFLAVVLIEVFGSVGAVLTYGIVRNVFTEQEEESTTSRWMNLYNCVWNEDGGGTLEYWDAETVYRTLNGLFENECSGLLDTVDVRGRITVDGKQYSAGCTKAFRQGKNSHWSPETFEAYKRGDSIVAVKSYYYPCSVGDILNINGKDYRVYDVDPAGPESDNKRLVNVFYFPYDSVPKGMEYYELTLHFTDIPTHAQADTVAERLTEELDFKLPVNMPEIPDLLVKQFNTTMLAGCGLAVLLIVFNCISVYMYIIRRRAGWIAAAKLCGCKTESLRLIILAEMLAVTCLSFGIGAAVSAGMIVPAMTKYYPLFDRFYSFKSYCCLFLGFIGLFYIAASAQLTPFVHRSVDRMRKEGV